MALKLGLGWSFILIPNIYIGGQVLQIQVEIGLLSFALLPRFSLRIRDISRPQ